MATPAATRKMVDRSPVPAFNKLAALVVVEEVDEAAADEDEAEAAAF